MKLIVILFGFVCVILGINISRVQLTRTVNNSHMLPINYEHIYSDSARTANEIRRTALVILMQIDTPKLNLYSVVEYADAIALVTNNTSNKHKDIDLFLILALASVESDFNPNAISIKNARGIHQVLPSSAEFYKQKLDESWCDKDLFNIENNTYVAMSILTYLLDRYGSLERALSSYNGLKPKPSSFSRKVLSKRREYISLYDNYMQEL